MRVAERVFDEMERALSDFLRTEDERAPAEYGFYYTPEGAPADVRGAFAARRVAGGAVRHRLFPRSTRTVP